MSSLLIKGGRVLDPSQSLDKVTDILIENGKVVAIGKDISSSQADKTLDASGRLVTPGLIDMHVHLREPGREDAETIYTGTRAAAAGGFTSVLPMANTLPVIDTQTGVNHLRQIARRDGAVHVHPLAAVTIGQKGEDIVEFGDLVTHGAIAFSDDGHSIMNAEIMRRALEYVSMFGVPILTHSEDINLSAEGMIHEGHVATLTGMKGIPSCAEAIQIARDIELADFTHGKLHVQHVSSLYSAALIQNAKKRKIDVTAEVTPHHLTLNEQACLYFDTNAKMNPPLRAEADRQALIKALNDGIIDIIASDHAPHTDIDKSLPFIEAPNGVIGMETAFPVIYTQLIFTGQCTLATVVRAMTDAPARRLRIPGGTLTAGSQADVAIFDLETERVVEPENFFSKSRNCPYKGMKLKGWPATTIVRGEIVFHNGEILV
ncbi:MAG: dihydroorotase [Candidatus Sumerlaeota bacterium]|nr:dihydroorotase [Candidatus Sumerlaeota bacterium]